MAAPIFSADEIFDKAEKAKVPPFYLIYGVLWDKGYLDAENGLRSLYYDSKLGIKAPVIKIVPSEDRMRNLRLIEMLSDLLNIHLLFTNDPDSPENSLMGSDEEDKYGKYLTYKEPFV